MAQHTSDLIWATKMTGKAEKSTTGSPTTTQEFGEYSKGTFNFFNGRNYKVGDERLMFKIKHAGENHEVYADIALDNTWTSFPGVYTFLQAGAADWYAKGNAGPFNAQIGTQGYGGFVSTFGTWNDYYQWNELGRFGVWRAYGPDGGFLVGDDFRTWNQWGAIAAVGVGFGDYKVSLGHRLNPFWDSAPGGDSDPASSKSSANASLLISGRPIDAISFDVFYSILGSDPNTFGYEEYQYDTVNADPTKVGKFQNIIGAYVGVNAIENLGLSIGYTANFNVYEKVGYYASAADQADGPSKLKTRTLNAPFFSGIDIHATYSGIDKIGLTFNNNISLAGAKGTEIKADSDKVTLSLRETGVNSVATSDFSLLDKNQSQDWFHWDAELKATFALLENVALTLHLGNRLSVLSASSESEIVGITTTTKNKRTDNEFRVAASAEYGIGAVTLGTGLFFSVNSKAINNETSASGLGTSTTTTVKANSDVVSFGIPIVIKVAF
jgi:hypothetical protein